MNRVLVAACSVGIVVAGAFCAVVSSRADDSASPGAPPAAPAAPEKEEKVRKLLRLTGSEAAARQVMNAMLEQFRKMPTLPAGFVDKFKAKIDVKALMDLSIPSYVKHLDDATLDAAIAFYETPAGQQWVAQQPAMMAETMAAGEAWGRKTAMDVMKELREEMGGKEKEGKDGKEDGKEEGGK